MNEDIGGHEAAVVVGNVTQKLTNNCGLMVRTSKSPRPDWLSLHLSMKRILERSGSGR